MKLLENKTKPLYNNKGFRYDNFGYNVFDLILKDMYIILGLFNTEDTIIYTFYKVLIKVHFS